MRKGFFLPTIYFQPSLSQKISQWKNYHDTFLNGNSFLTRKDTDIDNLAQAVSWNLETHQDLTFRRL